MEEDINLYGMATCSYCKKAKKALSDAGKKFLYHEVREDDPMMDEDLPVLVVHVVDEGRNGFQTYKGLDAVKYALRISRRKKTG